MIIRTLHLLTKQIRHLVTVWKHDSVQADINVILLIDDS